MSRTSRQARAGSHRPRAASPSDAGSLADIKCSGYSRSKIPQLLPRRMEEEEFQEADVLWPSPWPDTPPPSPEEEEEGSYDYDLPAAAPELLYEYDAAVVAFSCEPFSEPDASWSSSSTSLSAQLLSSDWSDGGGFFLSGASTVSAAGLELDATEEFLEADVLWPDTADDAAGFLWRPRRRSRRIEEAAASAAAAVFCGKREGCTGPLVASSPIDIPMATRGAAAARRRRP